MRHFESAAINRLHFPNMLYAQESTMSDKKESRGRFAGKAARKNLAELYGASGADSAALRYDRLAELVLRDIAANGSSPGASFVSTRLRAGPSSAAITPTTTAAACSAPRSGSTRSPA